MESCLKSMVISCWAAGRSAQAGQIRAQCRMGRLGTVSIAMSCSREGPAGPVTLCDHHMQQLLAHMPIHMPIHMRHGDAAHTSSYTQSLTVAHTLSPQPASHTTDHPPPFPHQWPHSSQFSPELRDLTKSLLSKNPKLRPSCDAILKLPWLKVRSAASGV